MITGIVLASGFSRRFGGNKLLAPFRGSPLFVHTLTAVGAASLDHLVVVTKYPEIIDYCHLHRIPVVQNKLSHLGQSQSVVLGVEAAPKESHFMFFTADQPLITTQVIELLLEEFRCSPHAILQPVGYGQPKNPVLFPSYLRQELLELSGDTGGRPVIEKHRDHLRLFPVPHPEELLDIDTKEDLDRLEAHVNADDTCL